MINETGVNRASTALGASADQSLSILFVYARGGPPLAHAVPRMAACARLHVLAINPLPADPDGLWLSRFDSVLDRSDSALVGDALVDTLVAHGSRLGVDAITTLSEFAVIAVAEAAARLGLRGAGPGVFNARDKRLMRDRWAAAGVPIPRYRRIDTLADLLRSFSDLDAPLILKPAWNAGSVGLCSLASPADAPLAWAQTRQSVDETLNRNRFEFTDGEANTQVLVEELVEGSASDWYGDDRYGDYVSVEGIVAAGQYHPVAITARLPPLPPFIEPANVAPCELDEPLQRRVEEAARAAVDALGLDTCGTHTEIKLLADGKLCLIESAARFGGAMIVAEIETVFGIDLVQMLVRELLGLPVDYPERMVTVGEGGAASVALISADSSGIPWHSHPTWDRSAVEWSRLLSGDSTISVVGQMTLADGTTVPSYDPGLGAYNWSGIFFLQARDAATTRRDCVAILDGMEAMLLAAEAKRSPAVAPFSYQETFS